MASKLAGQRAKFSRARSIFYTTEEEGSRRRVVRLMAEVLADAPRNGFSEAEVTQGEDVPDQVRDELLALAVDIAPSREDDPDELVAELAGAVDTRSSRETGTGDEFVYAYGYACAPDRLKIGSCMGDPVARIAAQIGTGTPDRPVLHLLLRTHDCRALERALHGYFRLRHRRVEGAGSEWFVATIAEVIHAVERIAG